MSWIFLDVEILNLAADFSQIRFVVINVSQEVKLLDVFIYGDKF
jgi:hypothetical protein